MISFTILTDAPKELRDRLRAYGLLDADNNPKEGVEIVEVPNPVVVTPAETDKDGIVITPAVYDPRHVFLVKVAHKAFFDEIAGKEQTDSGDGSAKSVLERTKLGDFVAKNSTADTVDGLAARKLGEKFWLVPDDDGRFGVWQ